LHRSFEGRDGRTSAFGPDGVDLVERIGQLARIIPDRQIARLLDRCGVVTGHGNGWSEPRAFRNHHEIEVVREGELVERGEIACDHILEVFDACVYRKPELS
jgi:hypothetical protein